MIVRIVLAAGEGRRLGRAKATAPLAGRSFLERVLAHPLPEGARSLVVTGAHREVTEAEALRLGAETVHNARWQEGQSRSLAVALEVLPPEVEGVVLHPVDFPLVRASDYAALLETWDAAARDPRRIAVVSHAMRRGHPILFASAWIPALRETLAAGGTARDVFRGAGEALRHVVVPHDGVLRDVDTPADLAAAEATLRGS